jgi:erythromycin esterase-like protein
MAPSLPKSVGRATGFGLRLTRAIFSVILLSFKGAPCLPALSQTAGPATEITESGPVVHELCAKRVALLGESPVHGFGKTLEFKVELVQRLINQSHYNALFVERDIYDYINIQKKRNSGQDVTDSMISAAIGGLWATKEVQPLIPFLREKVKAGSLTLGGLDDQIGAGTYASRQMSSDLVRSLRGGKKSQCLVILNRHMLWQYTKDAPYSPQDKAKIVGCLNQIEARLSPPGKSDSARAEQDRAMIDSLKRNFARDFTLDLTKNNQAVMWRNARDHSMYLNFR